MLTNLISALPVEDRERYKQENYEWIAQFRGEVETFQEIYLERLKAGKDVKMIRQIIRKTNETINELKEEIALIEGRERTVFKIGGNHNDRGVCGKGSHDTDAPRSVRFVLGRNGKAGKRSGN